MFRMNIQHRCMVMLSSRITHLERYQYIILYNNIIFQFMLRLWGCCFFFSFQRSQTFQAMCQAHLFLFSQTGTRFPKSIGYFAFSRTGFTQHISSFLFLLDFHYKVLRRKKQLKKSWVTQLHKLWTRVPITILNSASALQSIPVTKEAQITSFNLFLAEAIGLPE